MCVFEDSCDVMSHKKAVLRAGYMCYLTPR